MTYLSAESSVQDSAPRELVEISVEGGIAYHRHTSATRDIVFDTGNGTFRFTSIAIARGGLTVTMPSENSNDVSLTLPIDHPLAKRYTQQGVPPKKIDVTIWRQNGGETEIIWIGPITSMATEGQQAKRAKFRIPSRAGEWLLRPVASMTVGRRCPYIVYSAACGVNPAGNDPNGLALRVTTTVISVLGRDIRVDLLDTARNGTWAEGGDVYHPASGGRMTVGLQTDANPGASAVATLTMQMQIIGLKGGDSVQIRRGCKNTIADCETGFGNRQRFGGLPHLPRGNPFVDTTDAVEEGVDP